MTEEGQHLTGNLEYKREYVAECLEDWLLRISNKTTRLSNVQMGWAIRFGEKARAKG
jgi:hypothetical protein